MERPTLTSGGTYALTFTNTGNYPPPTVLITNPPNGTVFTAPANVTIQASASDNVSVTNVQFLVGSIVFGNDTTSPYSAVTNGLPAGNYTLSAIASDNLGAKARTRSASR